MVTVTTALGTARNDGRTAGHKKQKNVKRQIMTLPPVISSGGSILYGSTAQNRYSYDESRNLSCVREYLVFYTGVSVVTSSQTFFWEISRLSLTYDSYGYSHHGACLRSK